MLFIYSLIKCGFKEIEAGFPSASETEFSFIRGLIEKDEFPNDVWLQVRFSLQFPLFLFLLTPFSATRFSLPLVNRSSDERLKVYEMPETSSSTCTTLLHQYSETKFSETRKNKPSLSPSSTSNSYDNS